MPFSLGVINVHIALLYWKPSGPHSALTYIKDETSRERQIFNGPQPAEGKDMNPLAMIAVLAFLLAFGFAIYDRVPISDWLASHLLPL